MIPYVFWCSTCKKDHAGECVDQPGMSYLSRGKPAIGSRWVQEESETYVLLEYNTATKTAILRGSEGRYNFGRLPIWFSDGGGDIGWGGRVRYRRIDQ